MKRQFLQVAALSAAGYVLAFGNQLLLSYYYGTSAELDAYWVAMSAIQLVIFFVGPVREGLVPQFHRRWKVSRTDANAYFSGVLNALVIILAISVVVVLNFRGYLADMLVSGKQAQLAGQVSTIMLYMTPMVFLLALTEVGNSMLASLDKVVFQNMGRMVGALLFGTCILLLGSHFGVMAIVIAAIAGQVGFALFQARALGAEGLHYSPTAPPKTDRALATLAGAFMVSYALSQGYIVIERNALTYFGEGVVSAYQYALSLSQVPQMVLIASMAAVIWPKALDAVNLNEMGDIAAMLSRGGKTLAILLSVISVYCWVFAEQIVHVIFFRGAFNEDSLVLTATCFRSVLLALVPLGYSTLAGRVIVSAQRIKALIAISVLSTMAGLLVICIGRSVGRLDITLLHVASAALVSAIGCAFVLQKLLGKESTSTSDYKAGLWWVVRLVAVTIVVGFLMSLAPVGRVDKLTAIFILVGYFVITISIFAGGSYLVGIIDDETKKTFVRYFRIRSPRL